jgi:hypothetical protein
MLLAARSCNSPQAASGTHNTLITETVMGISSVERSVASSPYSFVRLAGGAIAPWLAAVLGERSVHVPSSSGLVPVFAAMLL